MAGDFEFLVGDVTKGEMGFAAIPGKEKEFQESIKVTVEYAKALGVKKYFLFKFILARFFKSNFD